MPTVKDEASLQVGAPSASDGLVEGTAYSKIYGGTAALGGSNPTTVATGLAFIKAASVVLQVSGAPGDGTSVLTHTFGTVGGTLNVYAWKPTSNSDPTLIASTGTENFSWIAIGT